MSENIPVEDLEPNLETWLTEIEQNIAASLPFGPCEVCDGSGEVNIRDDTPVCGAWESDPCPGCVVPKEALRLYLLRDAEPDIRRLIGWVRTFIDRARTLARERDDLRARIETWNEVHNSTLERAKRAEAERDEALSNLKVTQEQLEKTEPASTYATLHGRLVVLNNTGRRNSLEANAIRDEMDRPWLAMTKEQRDGFRRSDLSDEYKQTLLEILGADSHEGLQQAARRVVSERDTANSSLRDVSQQLPDGMEHCTIRLEHCVVGHSRLAPDNWIDHGCLICQCNESHAALRAVIEYEDTIVGFDPAARKKWEAVIEKARLVFPSPLED